MDASIIICTYNRAASLQDTLDALRALSVPSSRQWEVIVVDNNSKDNTRQAIGEVQRDWPLLRYEFVHQSGARQGDDRGVATGIQRGKTKEVAGGHDALSLCQTPG